MHEQLKLLPEIMRCFLVETKEDLDRSEMRNAANKALSTMVACGNEETVTAVVNGVATMVQSDNPGFQQASAPLLSAICEYPNK